MYIYKVAKSYGFSIRQEELKQNNKIWLADQTEAKSFFAFPNCHSHNVVGNYQQKIILRIWLKK
ncbi:hypothetical protein M666_14555 [Cellulophaga baltica 18]|uniref:Uncharacterized protein n=1 Tax=Cellulophaga baltica 18 TaxID=1348584 RepID=A0AAU8RJM7_9FLAO|nr:hypothetical protein M666_14555 [Cellulophaga baltica 18]